MEKEELSNIILKFFNSENPDSDNEDEYAEYFVKKLCKENIKKIALEQ